MLPQRRYQLEFGQPEGGYLEDLPIGLVNKLEAERVTKGSLRKAECDLGPLGIYEILGQLLHSNTSQSLWRTADVSMAGS